MEGISMSFGKMNTPAQILRKTKVLDAEGFGEMTDVVLASPRVYREGRHGSQRWANYAAFSEATELFRFRAIPGVTITTADTLLCGGDRFDILSVENVKGRGMYVEVLAKAVEPAG